MTRKIYFKKALDLPIALQILLNDISQVKKFYVAQEDVLLLDETEEKGGEVISKNFVMEFQ